VTDDEAAALTEADFVIITISTGGLEAMAHDLAIPEKYGIYQTVGDTVGPGGWSRTLRNVPVFVHLGEQLARYAPHAVVLNYTNPMASLTATLIEVSGLRTVGLCHGLFENYAALEALFGVEEQELSLNFGGLNHFFWVLDFAVRGEPGYPLLEERLGQRSLEAALHDGTVDEHGFHSHQTLASELYEQYGYLPYIADRHTSEFLSGYLNSTPEALERYNLKRTTIEERERMRQEARQRALELASGEREPSSRSRETAVDIIIAVSQHEPFVDVVNLPNEGQIDNVPRGVVVETLGLVDGLGFRPISVGALPPVIERLIAPHCTVLELTLDAALCGDEEMALQALTLDPLCSHLSPAEARAMGRELMQATKKWLPQFD
jgi:alpha-galactosidase